MLGRPKLTCMRFCCQIYQGNGSITSVYCSDEFHSYLFSPVPDYIKSTVETVMKIHQTEGDGDILAFLTGQVIPVMNRHVKAAPELIQKAVTLFSCLCFIVFRDYLIAKKNCLV